MAPTARKKLVSDQALARREPRQARALHKVGLMLEAAMRLIDRDGVERLTTNAVAEMAGVSIGTLYQYFEDKQALLDTLAEREVAALGERLRASLAGPAPAVRGDRVRAAVHAMAGAFGGRRRVHRQLIQHAMARGSSRIAPLLAEIAQLVGAGIDAGGGGVVALPPARAFVLVHAIAGVLRGLVTAADAAPPRAQVEDALVALVLGFVDPPR
jgi:AcrR family transcriptional regulator